MNPAVQPPLEQFEPKNEAERHALEHAWFDEERAMWRDGDHILRLARWRRAEILALAGPDPSEAALVRAMKRFIVQVKSLDPRDEANAQARAMRNERWYRGATSPEDRRQSDADWTRQHGSDWRHWRIVEYLYVADRCAHQIALALRRGEG